MGIFIHLCVSDTVTKSEWKRAYEKSLKLVKKLPFIDIAKKQYYGEELYCYVKTIEKEENGAVGWRTVGDSVSLQSAEEYYMPRHITDREDAEVKTLTNSDAYLGILPAYM